MMERTVTKRDGTEQSFDRTKIDRWAEYAARHKVNWQEIADETILRLPLKTTSEEIHETMIKVCLDREELAYSRVAARLLYAKLRKSMSQLNLSDKHPFIDIYNTFKGLGLWVGFDYKPEMAQQYKELYNTHLEY